MEEEDEEATRAEEENARTEQERLEHFESQLQAEVAELRQENTMLQGVRDSINAKLEVCWCCAVRLLGGSTRSFSSAAWYYRRARSSRSTRRSGMKSRTRSHT
jgi:hypothetical protein